MKQSKSEKEDKSLSVIQSSIKNRDSIDVQLTNPFNPNLETARTEALDTQAPLHETKSHAHVRRTSRFALAKSDSLANEEGGSSHDLKVLEGGNEE